jgi:hypothetical protein
MSRLFFSRNRGWKRPGRPPPEPCCRAWTLRLLQTMMPMAIVAVSFTVKTYVAEHAIGSGKGFAGSWLYSLQHPGYKYHLRNIRMAIEILLD